MANISLTGSIKSCRLDGDAWSSRLQSDRFLNPAEMLCPVWNNVDTSGRPACEQSYNTKYAGCNSARDRIDVENDLRPKYFEYVTLDAAGLSGNSCSDGSMNADAACNAKGQRDAHQYTGQFGNASGFQGLIQPNCQSCRNPKDRMGYVATQQRQNQWVNQAGLSNLYKKDSGMASSRGMY